MPYASRTCAPSMIVLALLAAVLTLPAPVLAQGEARDEETEVVINAPGHPLLQGFRWRSIGPTGQGGRVDDLAVHPADPRTFYVGFATGGLWKTTNNGTTFESIFDSYETHSIGALALAPSDPDVLYVGTGEANNRQSSSFGYGVYKSTDGGATFVHAGLRKTQSIARVLVHPTNPDVVWVAAVGHLFGPNAERGVFKSSDGGESWRHVLAVDEDTGATDLVMDPSNPDVLFASTYQRRRTVCCFVGGGPGSGIWRSGDGGESWSPVEGAGLPAGTLGRIALAMTPADPDIVYAQIEVAADREPPLSEEEQDEWRRLARVDSLPPDPQWSGVWRSTDKGRTWEFRSNENGRPMYFSQIRVSPEDPDLVYTVDQRVSKSRDGGRTWEVLSGYGHVDQHALWIDPADHDHLVIGNDGSVDVSWDQGETWESLRPWAVGQPYHASVDMRRPYYVCTGLQDNGSWCGPSSVRSGPILSQDWYRVGGGDGFYTQVDPTDPAVVFVESQNGRLRRVDLREGVSRPITPRVPDEEDPTDTNIAPAPPFDAAIRWNWNTPFLLSPHNPRILHAGGNRFFTSRDRGETWTMSPDLTKDVDRDAEVLMGVVNGIPRCSRFERGTECTLSRNDGVSMWGSMTSIAESPLVPGVLWAGTDDGNIQVSRDGGATWTEVSRNLPGGTTRHYVSRVEASHVDAATAYVSIDGHKNDDLRPYVYVTRNYGATWEDITSNLPSFGNVNTVRQDPRNPRLLYVGTEFGFYVSFDEGGSWHDFMPGLPVVRIDDVLVHPRENDLVLATHGRSVYVLDDVTALQALADSVLASDAHLFEPRPAVLWKNDLQRRRSLTGDRNWTGESAPPGTMIQYYLGSPADVSIEVSELASGRVVRELEGTGRPGLNRVAWDLRMNPALQGQGGDGLPVSPGTYRLTLTVGEATHSVLLEVLEDRWLQAP
ncbi:glycosyl hydrolase [Candidatus Palauibacter sp.]|uniref:glycosyl hydrolase n=1 Tax=Candidatus Palauibacter sp. TaxID=3101350 RepID=UPI003B02DAD0